MSVQVSEQYRFEHEVWFDSHRLGIDLGITSGTIKIRRGSDGYFWNGSAFAASEVTVATTVAGSTTDPIHYYDFTIPAGASDGEVFDYLMIPNGDDDAQLRFSTIVRDAAGGGGGMIAHQHVGEFAWDTPIERPD